MEKWSDGTINLDFFFFDELYIVREMEWEREESIELVKGQIY